MRSATPNAHKVDTQQTDERTMEHNTSPYCAKIEAIYILNRTLLVLLQYIALHSKSNISKGTAQQSRRSTEQNLVLLYYKRYYSVSFITGCLYMRIKHTNPHICSTPFIKAS
jgi:hypothetical protein